MKISSITKSKINKTDERTDYIIGSDLVGNLHKISSIKDINCDKSLLLTDKTVFNLYGKKVRDSLSKMNKPVVMAIINEGEESKSIGNVNKIIGQFLKNIISRNSLLLALGGGVVTDIGGFIASILLRGIDFVNIPTTLLAQVDAAIGGKTGVDFWPSNKLMYKNIIGTFKQPRLVISDIDTLKTLPEREIKNGLGEMVKYWIGWSKPEVSKLVHLRGVSGRTPRELATVINECQKIKMDIVTKDPFETKHIRDKLNLGHTIGHAIEGVTRGRLSHGEAVAIGLVAAARMSVMKGLLKEKTYQLIIDTVQQLGLPTKFDLEVEPSKRLNLIKNILSTLKFDKKGGDSALIKDIGHIETNIKVEQKFIEKVLKEIIL